MWIANVLGMIVSAVSNKNLNRPGVSHRFTPPPPRSIQARCKCVQHRVGTKVVSCKVCEKGRAGQGRHGVGILKKNSFGSCEDESEDGSGGGDIEYHCVHDFFPCIRE